MRYSHGFSVVPLATDHDGIVLSVHQCLTGFHRFPPVFNGFHRFYTVRIWCVSPVFTDFVFWAFIGFRRFSPVSTGFHRFSPVLTGFHRFSPFLYCANLVFFENAFAQFDVDAAVVVGWCQGICCRPFPLEKCALQGSPQRFPPKVEAVMPIIF
jgi:hypothetical protein